MRKMIFLYTFNCNPFPSITHSLITLMDRGNSLSKWIVVWRYIRKALPTFLIPLIGTVLERLYRVGQKSLCTAKIQIRILNSLHSVIWIWIENFAVCKDFWPTLYKAKRYRKFDLHIKYPFFRNPYRQYPEWIRRLYKKDDFTIIGLVFETITKTI